MKKLFDETSFSCSKIITQRYSTSFTLGIQTLDKNLHNPIYGIYAYVRYADEIVDTFHDYDKRLLFEEFKKDTWAALERKISLNPVLNAFQEIVNTYQIPKDLIIAFLDSMEMDLEQNKYQESDYQTYIYGSAEVVGLMCLKVFCNGNTKQYNELKDSARSLGAAFQKVNFLRDIQSDFDERGRVYFPNVQYNSFNSDVKKLIEADIQKDFDHAYQGIIRLPKEAQFGVYLAYVYYRNLFEKIRNTPSSSLKESRIRVPDFQKIVLLIKSYFKFRLQII